ncbi:hypothetical protein G9C98_004093 [Cotesia typhae]|uniref:Uncharacterized protein n=1 Tax=Cotesia typhae TaxID=2053667 RepID=A0A8J5R5Y6_9HYME|nr:hypothetical protein G9C98_004093 [Cotesia typhae]
MLTKRRNFTRRTETCRNRRGLGKWPDKFMLETTSSMGEPRRRPGPRIHDPAPGITRQLNYKLLDA